MSPEPPTGEASPRTGPRRRIVWTAVVAAVVAAAGFASLGLPGFAVLAAAAGAARLLGAPDLRGDQVWPAALAIAILGPFLLVPADLLAGRLARSRPARAVLAASLALAANVALCCAGLLVLPRD